MTTITKRRPSSMVNLQAAIDSGLIPVVIDFQAPSEREVRGRPLYIQSAIVGGLFAAWWGLSAIAGFYLLWGVFGLAVAAGVLVAGPVGVVSFAIWAAINMQAYRQYVEFLPPPPSSSSPPPDARFVPVHQSDSRTTLVDVSPRPQLRIGGLVLSGRDVSALLRMVLEDRTLRRDSSGAGPGLDRLPDLRLSGRSYGVLRAALEDAGYVVSGRWSDAGIAWLQGGHGE